jgi:hypothetical protein
MFTEMIVLLLLMVAYCGTLAAGIKYGEYLESSRKSTDIPEE